MVAPFSKLTGAGACAGSTAGIMLIMAGAAMGGMMGIRWLMMGGGIVRSTIGALVLGVAVNSNKVVKHHDGDQESSPLTLFGCS